MKGLIIEVGLGIVVDIECIFLFDFDVVFINSYGGEWDVYLVL